MANVSVKPMPEKYKKYSKKFMAQHPPIFTDCGPDGPTQEEIELARELFALLDEESKAWYGRTGIFKDL